LKLYLYVAIASGLILAVLDYSGPIRQARGVRRKELLLFRALPFTFDLVVALAIVMMTTTHIELEIAGTLAVTHLISMTIHFRWSRKMRWSGKLPLPVGMLIVPKGYILVRVVGLEDDLRTGYARRPKGPRLLWHGSGRLYPERPGFPYFLEELLPDGDSIIAEARPYESSTARFIRVTNYHGRVCIRCLKRRADSRIIY
jgi:hypothetical protein